MKKIGLIIITILFTLSINNVKAESYCKYSNNTPFGSTLVVYETGSGAIGYTINNEKVSVKLADEDFYTNGKFSCAVLPWESWKVNNEDYKNDQVYIYSPSTNKNAYNAAVLTSTVSDGVPRVCYYEYEKDKNHYLRLTMSLGKNELNFNVLSKDGIDGVNTSYVNLNDFLDANGIFNCNSSNLNIAFFKDNTVAAQLFVEKYDTYIFSSSTKCNNSENICIPDGSEDSPYISKPLFFGTMKYTDTNNLPDYFFHEGTVTCDGLLSGKFGQMVRSTLNFLKFIVPIIIIGFTIVDFIKAVVSQDNKEINKAGNKLIKRIIIGIVIFLVPTILEIVLDLAGIPYGTCGIK